MTRFTRALVRQPGASAVHGLRAIDRGMPDVVALRAEHAAYVDVLRSLGVAVDVLPPLEAFPDSVFVEDPALVLPDAAIVLRPGAASRAGEAAAIAPELEARFGTVHRLAGGRVEGGDVLVTDSAVYIGLSSRTDRTGAAALASALETLGRRAVIVDTPPGVLHLKTACALVDDRTLLVTRALALAHLFDGFELMVVPDDEAPAANALRVNEGVLVAGGFPRTADLLARRGFDVCVVTLDEVMKLDAGASCLSLRW